MLLNILLIVLFSFFINWINTLSIVSQFSKEKKIVIASNLLAFTLGIACGFIVYLL